MPTITQNRGGTVIVRGPIFDREIRAELKDAIREQITMLGDVGTGYMVGFIVAGGFEDTGRTWQSVEADVHHSRGRNAIGWVKVLPTDVWQRGRPGRPTRDWMETGRRGGVRLRRGVYAFRKTTRRLKRLNFESGFADRIERVLDGA